MGKITMNELDDSLIEKIDQNADLSSKQDKTDNNLITNNKTVIGAINELFQNVDSGKQLIAGAIGDSSITKDSTFQAMSNAIAGRVKPAGTAVAADVLNGKTFINNTGNVITGTMNSMGTHTRVGDYVAYNDTSIYMGIPAGAYLNSSATGTPEVYIEKTRLDENLKPENIISGKSICGVVGTAGGYNMIPGTKYVMSQGYVDGRSNPTLDMCTVYIKRDGRLTVNITFHGENRNEYIHAYTKDANGNVINTQSYDAGFGANDAYWNGVQVYANTYLNIVIQTNNGWYGKSYHWWYAILFDLE